MNDFTKDELYQIHSSLIMNEIDRDHDLINKVSLLIDNYCGHKDSFIYEKIKVCLACERTME